MKYFIDTEFLEGRQREKFPISLIRKYTPPTIDLISIGIVSEDGRELYEISKDFNLDEAWNRFDIEKQTPYEKQNGFSGRKKYWIRDNVLKPIWIDLFLHYESEYSFLKNSAYDEFERQLKNGDHDSYFTLKSLKALVKRYGKTNKEIADEVVDFCSGYPHSVNFGIPTMVKDNNIEFYAYYADYDWVVFCWLFGKMMDLPKGFPMYCRDLKQMLDEKVSTYYNVDIAVFPINGIEELDVILKKTINVPLSDAKNHPLYPTQENEHSAIDDAHWNKKFFDFLKKL